MSRKCSICASPNKQAIDAALVANEANRRIAAQYGVSEAAVRRHEAAGHVAVAMAEAGAAADADHGAALVAKVAALEDDAKRIGAAAEKAGDLRIALQAVRELVRICELQARLLGELNDRAALAVAQVDNRTEIIVTYADDPDPTAEVRERLRQKIASISEVQRQEAGRVDP